MTAATAPHISRVFWDFREDLAYQRMTTAEWRAALLAELDRPIIRGHVRQLVAKRIGPGVVELRLAPLEAKR